MDALRYINHSTHESRQSNAVLWTITLYNLNMRFLDPRHAETPFTDRNEIFQN